MAASSAVLVLALAASALVGCASAPPPSYSYSPSGQTTAKLTPPPRRSTVTPSSPYAPRPRPSG